MLWTYNHRWVAACAFGCCHLVETWKVVLPREHTYKGEPGHAKGARVTSLQKAIPWATPTMGPQGDNLPILVGVFDLTSTHVPYPIEDFSFPADYLTFQG